jgi:hypothetical protein
VGQLTLAYRGKGLTIVTNISQRFRKTPCLQAQIVVWWLDHGVEEATVECVDGRRFRADLNAFVKSATTLALAGYDEHLANAKAWTVENPGGVPDSEQPRVGCEADLWVITAEDVKKSCASKAQLDAAIVRVKAEGWQECAPGVFAKDVFEGKG